jgi:DNA-binding NtrC family response regulator
MAEKGKVLVVDDDRRMVKTICDILTAKGYEAEPAHSGEEAVVKARAEKPCCVLMDLKMEGMDGIGTLKLLKQLAPGLPVVLMSAYATKEQLAEAERAGACSVLTKPVDMQTVLSFLALLREEVSVLIVDDDPAFCSSLKGALEARGYRAETEGDPDKVLGHMEHDHDLVVLDLKPGATDGMEVLGEIRSRYPSKPVVLVAGCRDETTGPIEKARRIGAYACLCKPFDAERLIEIIEEIRYRKLRAFLGEPFGST